MSTGSGKGHDAARRGLGRGLEALIGARAGSADLVHIPLGAIRANPRQPRRRIDEETLAGLAASVRTQGIVQPLLVRPDGGGGYELIAGERRWRAARAAGLATVPALVRESGERDSLLFALVENAAREDLSAIEEARAYAALMDEFGLSLADVAERVGRSKPSVSNRLRLLELPDEVLDLVERGDLSEGHARAVLAVPDHEERRRLARLIARRRMSVRAAEAAARRAGARRKAPRVRSTVDPHLAARARAALERLTGATVNVTAQRIEIELERETRLAEIVEALESSRAGAISSVG
ncbi:MAG: ParB/RepB/Spo0J family partition protein [Actinomycetota bacterium]|nr:ParB/RepB/Spo0J family partition protein [Actinomycetota bacterium]